MSKFLYHLALLILVFTVVTLISFGLTLLQLISVMVLMISYGGFMAGSAHSEKKGN